jgi:TolB-like protein
MAYWGLQLHMAGSRVLRYGFLAVCLAIALGLVLAFQHWRARSKSAPQIHAIVVLPLRNVSGDSSQQYLADGMTEKLISDLGQISALRVISRTSSMSIRSSNNGFPEIARELGIDGVVDGSVVREGNQIRITAQLTDVRTGRHIWRHDYVRNLASALKSSERGGTGGGSAKRRAPGGIHYRDGERVINGKEVRELSLNARDWTQLASLEPGVAIVRTQTPTNAFIDRANRGLGTMLTVAGARPQQDNYRLDLNWKSTVK